jgi:hypothetical protein
MNPAPVDPVLRLPKAKARVVSEAIAALVDRNVVDGATRDRIAANLQPIPFDWRRLARYSFLASIACVAIAITAAATDEWLMQLVSRLFKLPWSVKAANCAVLSAIVITLGVKRRSRCPEKIYSNEAIFFVGVLGIGAAIACLGKAMDNGSGHFSVLVLLGAVIYGVLGLALRSKLIWAFSLFSLGGWFGAETGYMSGWGAYYLGMAYPLRFVLFGLALTCASLAMPRRPLLSDLFGVTRVFGLLYLFIALWILSIWGNCDDYEHWHRATRFELFHWAIYFAAAAIAAIYYGLKQDDVVVRGFGLTFLGINLYTKFFEYFWDGLHKAIFFAILGISFWLVGARAESIWQMRPLKKRVVVQNGAVDSVSPPST